MSSVTEGVKTEAKIPLTGNESKSGRGLSATSLKYIAIAAMLIDHIAAAYIPVFHPGGTFLRFLGRITGPIMFFFIVEGFHNTKNFNAYVKRMAIFAVVSYYPFINLLVNNKDSVAKYFSFNILYTLVLCLLALKVIHGVLQPLVKAGIVIVLLALTIVGDWAIYAVLYTLAFDYFRKDRKKQIMAGGAVVFIQMVTIIIGILTENVTYHMLLINIGQILPLVLLCFYNGKRGSTSKFNKWFFYAFYPAHLIILIIIRMLVFDM